MRRFALMTTTILALAAVPAVANEWAVEGFGGVRLGGTLQYGLGPAAMDSGSIFGARVLYSGIGSIPKLSFGLEYSQTSAEEASGTELNSRALMAVARWDFPTAGPVDFYAGMGLGAIEVEYDGKAVFPPGTGTDTVLGGEVTLGVVYGLSDRFGIFGEYTYQAGLENPTISGVFPVEYRSSNLAMGVRLEF